MKILGIETSCDETGVCLIEVLETKDGPTLTILGNQLYSQASKHKEFGGVFPSLAKREHAKNLIPLLKKCLEEAEHNRPGHQNDHPALTKAGKAEIPLLLPSLDKDGLGAVEKILSREPELFIELKKFLATNEKPSIDTIAVTNGPGLEPALWVGVTFAKALSLAWNIPIIPTNHMEGHIVAALLQKQSTVYDLRSTKYPAIALLISGGHTQLVLIKNNLQYEIIGNTCDDAVGEAFDKVARMLGLPYPGGPQITQYADEWKNKKSSIQTFKFPRPMLHSDDLNFSFSGLKTSVLYTIKKIPELTEEMKQEIAYEFKQAVIDVLVTKTQKAILKYGAVTLIVGGGVIADKDIRLALEKMAEDLGINFQLPEIKVSTDNALMIALAGYIRKTKYGQQKADLDFKADGNLSL